MEIAVTGSMNIMDGIIAAVVAPAALSADQAERLLRSVEDTMAVAFAGWSEPAPVAVRGLHAGDGGLQLSDNGRRAADAAALVVGTAAHALDYDDVHLTSVTHPSAVILPALIALANSEEADAGRFLAAYAVGLAVTAALGELMDFSHYEAGWHASSTIGPVAAAAAGCHFLSLSPGQARSALSIAAAQSGGMQINFGTDAKPLHIGFAAAAAVRSVRLARAGLSGAPDLFAPRGYLDLFAPNRLGAEMSPLVPGEDRVSVKLYPCCYAAHRMVAAALRVHSRLGTPDPEADFLLEVPQGLMTPLNVTEPATGAKGKFCASYIVAAALTKGSLGLSDFEDLAVRRRDVRALMGRIEIREQPGSASRDQGIGHGTVSLSAVKNGATLARADVRHYPGSPQNEATKAELDAKIADCLAIYRREHHGDGPGLDEFRREIRLLTGAATMVDA